MVTTVQAPGFSTSVYTGSGIKGAQLHSYRVVGPNEFEKLPDHLMSFESSVAAWEYARQQGYSIPYVPR